MFQFLKQKLFAESRLVYKEEANSAEQKSVIKDVLTQSETEAIKGFDFNNLTLEQAKKVIEEAANIAKEDIKNDAEKLGIPAEDTDLRYMDALSRINVITNKLLLNDGLKENDLKNQIEKCFEELQAIIGSITVGEKEFTSDEIGTFELPKDLKFKNADGKDQDLTAEDLKEPIKALFEVDKEKPAEAINKMRNIFAKYRNVLLPLIIGKSEIEIGDKITINLENIAKFLTESGVSKENAGLFAKSIGLTEILGKEWIKENKDKISVSVKNKEENEARSSTKMDKRKTADAEDDIAFFDENGYLAIWNNAEVEIKAKAEEEDEKEEDNQQKSGEEEDVKGQEYKTIEKKEVEKKGLEKIREDGGKILENPPNKNTELEKETSEIKKNDKSEKTEAKTEGEKPEFIKEKGKAREKLDDLRKRIKDRAPENGSSIPNSNDLNMLDPLKGLQTTDQEKEEYNRLKGELDQLITPFQKRGKIVEALKAVDKKFHLGEKSYTNSRNFKDNNPALFEGEEFYEKILKGEWELPSEIKLKHPIEDETFTVDINKNNLDNLADEISKQVLDKIVEKYAGSENYDIKNLQQLEKEGVISADKVLEKKKFELGEKAMTVEQLLKISDGMPKSMLENGENFFLENLKGIDKTANLSQKFIYEFINAYNKITDKTKDIGKTEDIKTIVDFLGKKLNDLSGIATNDKSEAEKTMITKLEQHFKKIDQIKNHLDRGREINPIYEARDQICTELGLDEKKAEIFISGKDVKGVMSGKDTFNTLIVRFYNDEKFDISVKRENQNFADANGLQKYIKEELVKKIVGTKNQSAILEIMEFMKMNLKQKDGKLKFEPIFEEKKIITNDQKKKLLKKDIQQYLIIEEAMKKGLKSGE